MVFIVILVVIFITLVILVQAGVMPWFIRTEGQRLRTQVDALATSYVSNSTGLKRSSVQ
ncbi:hypothetical protein [Enterobacter cloacae]|uniref:hypothetical protein n=1 Tax=Enterobacter cloacae TaxID=550 RepID=UPI001CC3A4A2|nr:hypothetical protein [Enterobacter cloacae]